MKVNPLNEEEQPRTEEQSTLNRVATFVWSSAILFGFLPLNYTEHNHNHNHEHNHSISFKFFSLTTLFSFARLVLFNSPFTFLPVILFLNFGRNELEQEHYEAFFGMRNGTITTIETALRVDFVFSFTLFILPELEKNTFVSSRKDFITIK